MIRALALVLLPVQVGAVTLDMPANAVLAAEVVEGVGSYDMPTAMWTPTGMPVLSATGEVRQQAWRVATPGLTTQQLLTPLIDQLVDSGFEVLFSCTDDACGGFDFRFATPVLPAPDMHVDIGDYRFVATRRSINGEVELLSLLASRSTQAGYIQIMRVGTPDESPVSTADAPSVQDVTAPTATGDFAQQLERNGRFVLSDLAFQTGSAQLGEITFGTLDDLASYLLANPNRTVALVGHTDSVGALDGNIALSKRRAGSVLERLVTAYNVPRRQLDAQGMGYLAPVASNLTETGRDANRRVEVIITSTE